MEINPDEKKWFWDGSHTPTWETRYYSLSLKGQLGGRQLKREATTQYLARHGFSGAPWVSGSILTIDIWEKKWISIGNRFRQTSYIYPSQIIEFMSKKSNTHKVDARRLGII